MELQAVKLNCGENVHTLANTTLTVNILLSVSMSTISIFIFNVLLITYGKENTQCRASKNL